MPWEGGGGGLLPTSDPGASGNTTANSTSIGTRASAEVEGTRMGWRDI
jgi:hypothetical protein